MLGSMTSSVPLNELGQFPRKRGSDPSPRTVGRPETGGHRQVPGLRRREVAHLASISTEYHTRLEQGRIAASAPVLDTLARVLHLDDDERGYLFQLAGTTVTRTRRRGAQRIQPRSQRVLDGLTTHTGDGAGPVGRRPVSLPVPVMAAEASGFQGCEVRQGRGATST